MKMNIDKIKILDKLGYTGFVYARINKKLKTNLLRTEIKNYVFQLIE